MQELTVHRWTRHGQDRLYVRTVGGYEVGYLDRITGERVLEDTAWQAAFDSAVADVAEQASRLDGRKLVTFAEPRTNVDLPADISPAHAADAPQWRDLALNLPGQAVLTRAQQIRQSAPVRTLVERALHLQTDERAWRLGGKGEVAVAKQLNKLPRPWRTLHSVPVGPGESDIDHVVIGPGGVFTVNTKHHPDARVWVGGNTVMINGHKTTYVRNSRHEAERAARILSAAVGFAVNVGGVIAIYGARGGVTIRQQPPDGAVVVLKRHEIDRWIAARPALLGAAELDAIFDAARRSTTWA